MLQMIKTMAYSKAEDQRAMLDTILDGADKAARTVANIRSIKEGKEPPILEPLAKEPCAPEPSINDERESMNLEQPAPPKQPGNKPNSFEPIEEIYSNVGALRTKLDNYYDTGVVGKKELNELIIDVYTIQTKLFTILKNK